MALPGSGAISMGDINVELGRASATTFTLNDADVRGLAQLASGTIGLANFYGKSNVTPIGGLFGGHTTTYLTAVDLYNFSNNSVSSGTALSTGLSGFGCVVGTASFAMRMGGMTTSAAASASNVTVKYAWANGAQTSGTNLLSVRRIQVSGSSANYAVTAAGGLASGYNTTTDRYVFSNNGVAAGTSLGSIINLASASYPDGMISGGGNQATTVILSSTNRYTLSTNASVGGTALGQARSMLNAGGNATYGLFANGFPTYATTAAVTTTDVYTYSNNARVAGTALSAARSSAGNISNKTSSITCGGTSTTSGVYLSDTKIYKFSDNTVTSGGTLTALKSSMSGASNVHGGL